MATAKRSKPGRVIALRFNSATGTVNANPATATGPNCTWPWTLTGGGSRKDSPWITFAGGNGVFGAPGKTGNVVSITDGNGDNLTCSHLISDHAPLGAKKNGLVVDPEIQNSADHQPVQTVNNPGHTDQAELFAASSGFWLRDRPAPSVWRRSGRFYASHFST